MYSVKVEYPAKFFSHIRHFECEGFTVDGALMLLLDKKENANIIAAINLAIAMSVEVKEEK